MKPNRFVFIPLFGLFFLLSGCEQILDCVVGIRPELEDTDLPNGSLHQNYSQLVVVEMKNTSNDDAYYITDIDAEGNLPPGITYDRSGSRSIEFYGIPTTAGTYNFKLVVTVQPSQLEEDGSDGLCSDSDTQYYEIVVN